MSRVLLAVVLLGALVGCRLQRMTPTGPVISEERRRNLFSRPASSGASYRAEPRTSFPAVPFLVFGIPYDLDIVLVSDHPKWEMHEYARIRTPDGPIWIAKDTRHRDGDQLLVSDSDLLETGAPEVPLARKSNPMEVENRSEGNWLDIEIRYRNFDGRRVRVRYEGPKPRPVSKRNGSTMGHSRHQALAVLDLSHRSFGRRASISIGGTSRRIRRILGVQPLRLALRQVQAGIPDADYTLDDRATGLRSVHRSGGASIPRSWTVERLKSDVVLRQESRLRTLQYRFRRGPESTLELVEASVRFWNDEEPTFRMRFAPALPDVRRRFEGVERGRWVMDVGGEKNHAVGTVRVQSTEGGAELRLRGDAPWWVEERCVESALQFDEQSRIRVETDVRPCEEGG